MRRNTKAYDKNEVEQVIDCSSLYTLDWSVSEVTKKMTARELEEAIYNAQRLEALVSGVLADVEDYRREALTIVAK